MERRKKESKYRTFEVLSIFASIVTTVSVVLWGIQFSETITIEQRAKSYAQILGYSLWQIELNGEQKSKKNKTQLGRGPASINDELGVISRDPWGHPYFFKVRSDKQLIYIWSLGANGKNESDVSHTAFSGDDLGFILDFKIKN